MLCGGRLLGRRRGMRRVIGEGVEGGLVRGVHFPAADHCRGGGWSLVLIAARVDGSCYVVLGVGGSGVRGGRSVFQLAV